MLIDNSQTCNSHSHDYRRKSEKFSVFAAEETQTPIDKNHSERDGIQKRENIKSYFHSIGPIEGLAFEWPECRERPIICACQGRDDQGQNGNSLQVSQTIKRWNFVGEKCPRKHGKRGAHFPNAEGDQQHKSEGDCNDDMGRPPGTRH